MCMLHVKRGPRVEEEAAALAAARHPGVVELVDVVDGALRTVAVDGARPLATAGPFTPDEVAGVLAAVASTLADLHEQGLVHGGIDADHVLVGGDGRIVLCSLGRGGDATDDVAALGLLVGGLLAAAGPGRPGPPRPGPESPGRPPLSGPFRRRRPPPRLGAMLAPAAAPVVAAVAAEASASDPLARPTARALASAVRQRVPTARLPHPPGRPALLLTAPAARPGVTPVAARRAVHHWPTFAVRVGLGSATVVAAVGVAVAGPRLVAQVVPASDAGPARASPASPITSGGSRGTASGAAAGASGDPSGRSPTDPGAGAAPARAVRVWPPEPLAFADGVLTVGDARYALGLPGDLVVSGDWRCTGSRTVALLRPGTGEVFAFDGWPVAGEEAVARPLGTVAGATAMRAVDPDGDGCDDLEVARGGGAPVPLDPAL